jgi:hypothetical protein
MACIWHDLGEPKMTSAASADLGAVPQKGVGEDAGSHGFDNGHAA